MSASAANSPRISVIIPTHNPDRGRLERTLLGLREQTLPVDQWETLLIDNASSPAVDLATYRDSAPANTRTVHEAELGLTAARRRGFTVATAEICVLVDDDNVLAVDYLEKALALFAAHSRIGALGGRSLPEFAVPPEDWVREFDGLIACRDLGPQPRVSTGLRPDGATQNEYPAYAPIGAGMAVRRAAIAGWLAGAAVSPLSDRRGGELTSSGDNDIVLTLMRDGWEVGYFPELSLLHLIPASRLAPDYLARLNRGIQKSWMQVLARHDASPWPPLTEAGANTRKLKAWFTYRAWSSPAARIRWQGACGHFDGRVIARTTA